jgi:hypothetical protein
MRYLRIARNITLPRVSVGLLFAISSANIAGFSSFGSLTDTIRPNEARLMQLTIQRLLSFTKLVSSQCVSRAST